MAYILRETEASVIVCSSDALKKLNQIEIQTLPSLMAVIVMDEYSDYQARQKNCYQMYFILHYVFLFSALGLAVPRLIVTA